MQPSSKPSESSGLNQENDETLLSPSSPQKKTRSKSKPETQADPLKTGLESSTLKKKSDHANGNGEKSTEKQDNQSLLPVPKPLPKPVDRAQQALKRLGVDVLALRSAPEITPLLKNAQGGLKAVLGAMRFTAEDPSIAAFLEKYDSVPAGDRERVSWEAIALAAGVDLRVFLGSIMLALQSQAVNTVKIIAMTNHPKITAARVKYGLLPSGEKDRTALDTAMGFLPSPKGPTFIGKAVFGSGGGGGGSAPAQMEDDDLDEEDTFVDAEKVDLEKFFPSSNAIQQKLIPVRQKMLEDGK